MLGFPTCLTCIFDTGAIHNNSTVGGAIYNSSLLGHTLNLRGKGEEPLFPLLPSLWSTQVDLHILSVIGGGTHHPVSASATCLLLFLTRKVHSCPRYLVPTSDTVYGVLYGVDSKRFVSGHTEK